MHDVADPARQHAAVGVAQRDHLGAGLVRGAQHLQRVVAVVAVAVEEVLGVEEHPLALGARGGPRCRAPSRGSPPAWCAARARRAGRATWPPASRRTRRCRAARRPAGRRPRPRRPAGSRRTRRASACWRSSSSRARRKNSVSLGFAPGQPPSMKPTPSPSSWRAMAELVGDREVQPLLLGAVAQGRVVDVERVAGSHLVPSLLWSSSGAVGQQKDLPWGREVSAPEVSWRAS